MVEQEVFKLPVLPLRDIVVFPNMIVRLFVGREKSVKALESVMANDQKIILATQKEASVDEPNTENIFTVGVLAQVLQICRKSLSDSCPSQISCQIHCGNLQSDGTAWIHPKRGPLERMTKSTRFLGCGCFRVRLLLYMPRNCNSLDACCLPLAGHSWFSIELHDITIQRRVQFI